jgi:hypothetical protein
MNRTELPRWMWLAAAALAVPGAFAAYAALFVGMSL